MLNIDFGYGYNYDTPTYSVKIGVHKKWHQKIHHTHEIWGIAVLHIYIYKTSTPCLLICSYFRNHFTTHQHSIYASAVPANVGMSDCLSDNGTASQHDTTHKLVS